MGLLDGLFGGGSAPEFKKYEPSRAGSDAGRLYFGEGYRARGLADPKLQRDIIEAEREFAPQYLDNALGLQERAMFGGGDAAGLLEQQQRAAGLFEDLRSDIATRQRTSDVADVEALGGRATAAVRASDPQRQALMERQEQLTNHLFDRAYGLTPQEERLATQRAREGFAARGRVDDNASMFAEALNREEFLRANRQEAQQAGQGLFGMYQQSNVDPFTAVLGRGSNAAGQAGQLAYQAMGMGGQASPQLFNPDTGVNIGMQNNANQNQYNATVAGAQAAAQGSMMGGLFGGIGTALGGWLGG